MVKGLAAFWKGLLYSRESRDWAWDLVRRYPLEPAARCATPPDARGCGRAGSGRAHARRELATDLLEAASLGLCRQGACGQKGDDERVWLEPLLERARAARSPADDALEAFRRGGDAALSAQLRIAG